MLEEAKVEESIDGLAREGAALLVDSKDGTSDGRRMLPGIDSGSESV